MEGGGQVEKGVEEALDLPPGFRFHPTDEEIITCYLTEKVLNSSFSATAIGEADLNKCEPWDLPKRARMGEKEWYFFCQRDRKYPTGTRTNRATESGYWKATGKDREIYRGKGNLVGMKKTLVFYKGRAPKGDKTGWVMHEFRLEGRFATFNLPRAAKDEWVVCKIFHKNTDVKTTHNIPGLLRINSLSDHLLDFSPSLPPLMDPSYSGGGDDYKVANQQQPSSSDGYYLPNNNNNQTAMMMKAEQEEDYYTNYEMLMKMPTSYPTYSSWNDQQKNVVKNNETVSSWGMGIMDKKCNSGNMEHSMVMSVSQDTAPSNNNDRNAETCSAMSHMMRDNNNIGRNNNKDDAVYEEEDAFILHRPPSLPSLPADLDSLWDNY